MTDLSETLKAMRGQVEAEQASPLAQFRRDFALVWKTWIARGEATREEYETAGRNTKKHINEAEFLRTAMPHFAQMADQIRRDEDRSARIRAEVRAKKEAAKEAA